MKTTPKRKPLVRERLQAPTNSLVEETQARGGPSKPSQFRYQPETAEKRDERLRKDRLRQQRRRLQHDHQKADPTAVRLMNTIAECRRKEKEAWTMLSNYLATGRTVIRERLPGPIGTLR